MNDSYPEVPTGSTSLLGLNSKPKKKKAETPGLLQNQMNSAQEQKGALASLAQSQGALGTMNTGAYNESEQLKKKRKLGA